MPQVIEPSTKMLPPDEPRPFRWTVEGFENLFTMGLLPDAKFELLNGEIIEKAPISQVHALAHHLMLHLLIRLYGGEFVMPPFSLRAGNHDLPEPDIAVLQVPARALPENRFVGAEQVRLVVELSVSTLNQDLTTKANLYARAGIPEYWVLDVNGRRLLVHQTPGTDGYASVTEFAQHETVTRPDAPGSGFVVRDVLP